MNLKKFLPFIFLFFSLAITVSTQFFYDRQKNYFAEHKIFVNLPKARTAEVMFLAHRNLAADIYFIWAIQFYSTYYLENRFEYIEDVFNLITDLSPGYREAYVIGAIIMAYEKKDPLMALRLLEKGSSKNSQEWLYDFEAAFYCQKMLKDFDRAAYYLNRAAAKKDAPLFIKRQEAHLIYLKGDLESAWKMWMEIYNQPRDESEKKIAYNHLYQIKAELDISRLQEKIREFFNLYRRYPVNLKELVKVKLIKEVPLDFGGDEYEYDTQSGQIRSRRFFKWK